MNDTIKGIIIVAAIASMLVVGATTMIPIMQNSFASKKSEDEQGTLHISKICLQACGIRFPITVTGNNPQPSSFTLVSGHGQTVKLGPGSYTVHESVPKGFFTPRFTGDCKRTGPDSPDATGTISAGQSQSCHIINLALR